MNRRQIKYNLCCSASYGIHGKIKRTFEPRYFGQHQQLREKQTQDETQDERSMIHEKHDAPGTAQGHPFQFRLFV